MQVDSKKLSKSVVWNTIGTIYYFACQWLITILVIRIGNYSMSGYLSLAMTITNSFYSIAQFGMRQFQVSDINHQYRDEIYIGSRYVSIFVAFLACIIYLFCGHYDSLQISCTICYMLLKLVEAFVDVYQGIDQKNWHFDIIGISFLIRGTILAVGFATGLWLTGNLAVTLLIITLLSLVTAFLIDVRMTKPFANVTGVIRDRALLRLFAACIPVVVFNFLLSLVTLIARNTLQNIEGIEALGIYGAVASPTVIIQLMASVIFNPFVPVFTSYFREKKNKEFGELLGKFCAALVLLLGISLLAAKLFGKWVLVLIIGPSIADYMYLLIPVICSTIVTAAIWLLSATLIAIRKTAALVACTAVGVVISYFVATPLVKSYSMNGVSYAVVISGVVQILLMLAVCVVSLWRNRYKEGII